MKKGYKILDSDMHLREPADLWDKYLEPQWRERAPRILSSTARSSAMVLLDGKILQGYHPSYRGGIFDASRIDREIAEYRARGFDARTQLDAMDRSKRLLVQTQRVFDATHEDVVAEIQAFAAGRDADGSPFGWRRYVVSQQEFIRFCCHATIRRLFDSPLESERVGRRREG